MKRSVRFEKYFAAALFVVVLVVFAFAQENTRDMERKRESVQSAAGPQSESANSTTVPEKSLPADELR